MKVPQNVIDNVNKKIIIKNVVVTIHDVIRFYNKIFIKDDGCFETTLHRSKNGYSVFTLRSKSKNKSAINDGVHRFMYVLHNPNVDISNLNICHHCDNPSCVKPEHLFPGTQQDNMNDCVSKNRQMKGSVQPNSVLTEFDVVQILKGIINGVFTSTTQIMNHYNISHKVISTIINKKAWLHITKDYDINKIKNMISHVEFKKKLTVQNVKDIKEMLTNGETVKDIANLYNVDTTSIYRIKNNKYYKNII